MTVALLVMTDGRRDCIERTIPAVLELVDGPITRLVIHDDSADLGYRKFLWDRFPMFGVIAEDHRLGFGGAIRNAWSHLRWVTDVEYILHWEDDFVPHRAVDLDAMIHVLEREPDLTQIALRRQAWNESEIAAGGIIEQHPGDYHEVHDGQNYWLEHRRFFTTNPSLYRRTLTERTWPDADQSEGRFALQLFENPKRRSSFWGRRDDEPWVEHIGAQRVGTGY